MVSSLRLSSWKIPLRGILHFDICILHFDLRVLRAVLRPQALT